LEHYQISRKDGLLRACKKRDALIWFAGLAASFDGAAVGHYYLPGNGQTQAETAPGPGSSVKPLEEMRQQFGRYSRAFIDHSDLHAVSIQVSSVYRYFTAGCAVLDGVIQDLENACSRRSKSPVHGFSNSA